MTLRHMVKFLSVIGLCVTLSACTTAQFLFGDPPEEVLDGDRLTILELEEQLEPDPILQTSQISLPEIWRNQFWPQYYGYPNHAMGHVGLPPVLKRAFSVDIGEGKAKNNPLLATPIVADGRVFTLDTNLKISSFDANSGRKLWSKKITIPKAQRGDTIGGGIAYTSGRIYATVGIKTAYVIDPDNGQLLHVFNLPSPARAAPTVLDGKVYLQTLDNKVNVFDTETFEPAWNYNGFSETTSLLGASSPAVDKDVVIAAFTSGEVVAMRHLNGQTLWTDNLSSVRRTGVSALISDVRGGVVIDKGLVYAISHGGKMVAIDLLTGRRVWQREVGGSQTPWSVGNVVYVITDNQEVIALSRLDGRIYWVQPLPKFKSKDKTSPYIWHGPILAGGRLVVISNFGSALDLDPVTGEVLKGWSLKTEIATAPIVANDTLYIISKKGRLLAYREE